MLRRRPAAAVGVALLAALALAVGVLWLVPSDHYIVLPDEARPVDPLISVPGENESVRTAGIYMVDVRVGRASLFERLFPQVYEGASLVPERVINPVGVSDTQRRQSSLKDMTLSQKIAVTVALRELGRTVTVRSSGAEVDLVVPDAPADGNLEVGDIIVAARGQTVRSTDDLSAAMKPVRPGSRVTFVVRREGRRVSVELGTRADPDDKSRAVVGVQVQDSKTFAFPLNVEIDTPGIGGPSAGLAFALDIVDELGREVDRGRRVVATGSLSLDGDVAEIGGIRQKTFGARAAEADVFLVPDANAAEARRYADGLRVVAVSSFEEALAALATG
jgi:PDZ domain-containing protein